MTEATTEGAQSNILCRARKHGVGTESDSELAVKKNWIKRKDES